jgi:hypothetical protein
MYMPVREERVPGKANAIEDIELNELALVNRTKWVDIAHVRQYQQKSYTSLLRTRRGPTGIWR